MAFVARAHRELSPAKLVSEEVKLYGTKEFGRRRKLDDEAVRKEVWLWSSSCYSHYAAAEVLTSVGARETAVCRSTKGLHTTKPTQRLMLPNASPGELAYLIHTSIFPSSLSPF